MHQTTFWKERPKTPLLKPDIQLEHNTDVGDIWAKWSMTPHTEDEIRDMCLDNIESVCFSYVCRFSMMSPEFIEEFMALSTGVLNRFNYDEYKDDVINAVQCVLGVYDDQKPGRKRPQGANIKMDDIVARGIKLPNDTSLNNLNERMDWFHLARYQKLPGWFWAKYQKIINGQKGKGSITKAEFPEDFEF